MSNLKEELYEELKLKLALNIEGVNYEVGLFDKFLEENEVLKKPEYCTWDKELITKKSYNLPGILQLKHGFGALIVADKNSPYKIVQNDGVFGITFRGKYITDISFGEIPKYLSKKTKDGISMKDIALPSSLGSEDKSIIINYSTECSVKDNGKTCLFCVMNGTKGLEGTEYRPPWKYPHQIAETVKEAYEQEGYRHLTITGGFVPERREVEYYLDVAEHIKEALGTDTFNGTACIGAPLDFSVIDKYKEAGFSSIAFNTEVWGKEYFDIVCPGKVEACGGYDNWIKAIEYAIQVFGKGRVRSNFVVGLQPKEVLFEGFEYLASIGVVTVASPWVPGLGSPLEGHRTPTVDWHWDVQLRHADILRKYGRTYEEIFNATPSRNLTHDIYQIEDGTWPSYAKALKIS
jgi:biotin synthase-related radical SAM superfamily protein